MKKLIAYIKHLWDSTIFSSNNSHLQELNKDIAIYEDKIINTNGFSVKYYGRWGYVYYVENGNMCRIFSEYSGVPEYTILIAFEAHDEWHWPVKKVMTSSEKQEIKLKLTALTGKRKNEGLTILIQALKPIRYQL
ncbi:MAG: hypothetical protein M0D57_05630 [Sphingobacteriales bacterium JAD_PAG50586_3]|nr:MAG: hypothetical protein M0D57_05630 [Sphingobacteriales bacterium JAD_PAG50586_3]